MWVNINGNWIGRHSGQSLSSYWKTQPEVLFFGLYSEISGGQMPNKVDGGATYLTVAGSAGSETYKTPNTAPYIAADTDYIWFKTDISQRTTTTAELIGYDFTRTIVKYANTAPYAIEAIMILSSDVDTAKMRDDFDLSVWWSNVLSDYGNTKDNRAAEKSVWTAESVLDAATSALIARMTALSETPDETRQGVLDTAIKADKAASLWDAKYDAFWLTAAHGNDSGLLNILADEFNLTLVSNPTFTTDRGYAGNDTDAALNSNFNVSTDSSNFTQNSASVGIYIRNNRTTGQAWSFGSTGVIGTFNPRHTDDNMWYGLLQTAFVSESSLDSSGMWIITRTASNLVKVYRNGLEVDSVTKASGAIPSAVLYFLCNNNGESLDTFSDYEIALGFIAGGMTATDVTNFQKIWVDGYLDSIGAKV